MKRDAGPPMAEAARRLRTVPAAGIAPAAPAHLSKPSRAFWAAVVADYHFEPHHLAILQGACEAMDRVAEARTAIERDGAYVEGRFGLKAHPGLAVERDSRTAMNRGLRELGLDLDSPATSRPPSRWRD